MANENLIKVTQTGAVATIQLNRPEKYNAFNRLMLEQLAGALEHLEQAPHIRCIVLTGSGKAFAAGADITEYRGVSSDRLESFTALANRVRGMIRAHPLPIIAAVNGLALGGGFEMALACDMILCAEGAKLGLPELSLGLIPGWGGTQALTRLVGRRRAFRTIVLGHTLTADEALELGIVQAVVAVDDLSGKAAEYAAAVAAAPAEAVKASRKAIERASLIADDDYRLEQELLLQLFPSPDGVEGVDAFVEKRKPIFNRTIAE